MSDFDEFEDDLSDQYNDEDKIDNHKEPQDVGSFSLEEKLVSAVWVHERIRNNMSWYSLVQNFRIRFGCEPPSKRTLTSWERKLFSAGSVRDAVRTGRPCARLMHVPYVKASIVESPNLSLRERAQELGLPRSTLLKILKDDLKMVFVPTSPCLPEISGNNKTHIKKQKVITPITGVWKYIDDDNRESITEQTHDFKIKNERFLSDTDFESTRLYMSDTKNKNNNESDASLNKTSIGIPDFTKLTNVKSTHPPESSSSLYYQNTNEKNQTFECA